MEQKPVPASESPDFLCPSCGAAAFEIVEKQRNVGDGDESEELLVLRCLACLELFCHRLGVPQSAECGSVEGLSLSCSSS